jgi:hypothetical protein
MVMLCVAAPAAGGDGRGSRQAGHHDRTECDHWGKYKTEIIYRIIAHKSLLLGYVSEYLDNYAVPNLVQKSHVSHYYLKTVSESWM